MKNLLSYKNFLYENLSKEYDEILDIYNKWGEKGMLPEEIEFLKSGGTSEKPSTVSDVARWCLKNNHANIPQHVVDEIANVSIDLFWDTMYLCVENKENLKKLLDTYLKMHPEFDTYTPNFDNDDEDDNFRPESYQKNQNEVEKFLSKGYQFAKFMNTSKGFDD